MKRKFLEGGKYLNNSNLEYEIIEYVNPKEIHIKFLVSGHIKIITYHHISDGQIHDPLSPTVFGVGYLDLNAYKPSPFKPTWVNMLSRCYGDSVKAKRFYSNVFVCEDWKSLTNFHSWAEIQNYQVGWQLDKDIINKGSQRYSPENCAFVPAEINKAIILTKENRSHLPIGVTQPRNGGQFIARCSSQGKQNSYLGSFSTPEEAFYAYKNSKELNVKTLATKWGNLLDKRVYDSLLKWTVNIDD